MHDRNNTSSPWFGSVTVQGSPLTGQDLIQAPPANPQYLNYHITKKKKKLYYTNNNNKKNLIVNHSDNVPATFSHK